jgi:hypothetical protein
VNPLPENVNEGITMLRSPDAWFSEGPIIAAGLLAMTLGPSVATAAPANVLPSDTALFSRS